MEQENPVLKLKKYGSSSLFRTAHNISQLNYKFYVFIWFIHMKA